jgi:serine/threonine protein kinase
MPDMSRVDELLLEWESAWRSGRPVTPEQLCPDWPEGQAELRRRADLLRKFDAFSAGATPTAHYGDQEGPPPVIPGYTIRGKLGWGGMGIVYRAWQEDLGREVAIKVMKGGPNMPAHLSGRFAQEARVLAQLQHDHLVPIYEAKLHLGQPYFVMELIQGGNLSESISRFDDDAKGAAALVEMVARVVHYAHQQGVLHRDLKPANILLDKQGRPRVSDFGLAKLFGEGPDDSTEGRQRSAIAGTTTVSAGGGPMGTPPYMAPEQYEPDRGPATPRTDIWSLGVILYELLTGKRPFAGTDFDSYAKAVCEANPVRPRAIRPNLNEDLEAIVLKCLEKDSADRYATAAAVAEDLAAWKRGGFPRVSKASKARRIGRWLRRRPAVLGALLLAPALAIAVGAISIRPQPSPTVPVDPDLARKEIEGQLAKGEDEVELIGKTGTPKWFRSAVGGNRTHTFLADDGTFTVDSWEDLCLLELAPNPQRDRYVITAKVRHEKSNDLGEVGIYCGWYEYESGGLDVYTFVSFGFNDLVDQVERYNRMSPAEKALSPKPTGNIVFFPFRVLGRRQNKTIADYIPLSLDRANMFKPAGPGGRSWRTLVLKVAPGGIEGYWEEEQFVATIPTDGLAGLADKALLLMAGPQNNMPHLQQLHPTFPRRGGLGLYVRNSAASFCSVTVDR